MLVLENEVLTRRVVEYGLGDDLFEGFAGGGRQGNVSLVLDFGFIALLVNWDHNSLFEEIG